MSSIEDTFETRSEKNGIYYYESLLSAIGAWDNDPTIFKISYDFQGKDYRWRKKLKGENWKSSEKRLCKLSKEYNDAKKEEVFYVNQSLLPDNSEQLHCDRKNRKITEKEFSYLWYESCIIQVLSDKEFRKMANNMSSN